MSEPAIDTPIGERPTAVGPDELHESLATAAWHCRRGEWHRGLALLRALQRRVPEQELPGSFFAYLGQAVARCDRDLDEGLRLCRQGVEQEFFRGDAYWNLASVLLLRRDRRAAFIAVTQGLEVDDRNAELWELHRRLGVRRPPVLGFLRRRHPLNVFLGRLRGNG